MAGDFTAGVYDVGTFSIKNPTPEQQQQQARAVKDLVGSGMDVVVLASFHAHEDGSIYFNDTGMISGGEPAGLLNPELPDLLRHMSDSGITLLASFGGGGDFNNNAVGYWDFSCIKDLDAQFPDPADNPFYQNLAALFSSYPAITGLDVDLESYTGYDPFLDTVTRLIAWLAQNGKSSTIAPYDAPDFWTSVLKQSVDSDGGSLVSWVNLQSAQYRLDEFVPAFAGVWSNVQEHILAGLEIRGGDTPCEVQSTFYEIGQSMSGLRGGWLWRYDYFGEPASRYAEAIQQGLAGTSCS